MGKIIRRSEIKNVVVSMSRQRSKYGSGWEYPVWVSIRDKKKPSYVVEQDPTIFQDRAEADGHFDEIMESMKQDLNFGVHVYAPQIEHYLDGSGWI